MRVPAHLSLQRLDLGLKQPVLEHCCLAARRIRRRVVGSWGSGRDQGGWMKKEWPVTRAHQYTTRDPHSNNVSQRPRQQSTPPSPKHTLPPSTIYPHPTAWPPSPHSHQPGLAISAVTAGSWRPLVGVLEKLPPASPTPATPPPAIALPPLLRSYDDSAILSPPPTPSPPPPAPPLTEGER